MQKKHSTLITILAKTALIIELLILCAPAAAALFLGLISIPAAIVLSTINTELLYYILTVALGIAGLIAIGNLSLHIIFDAQWWPGLQIQWAGIASGVLACLIGLASLGDKTLMAIILIAPIAATTHLLYLSYKKHEPQA